ncbi:hypothetical protein Poli38472_011711 [Pythium oligandrum]|uniref:Uncharacterized protein n=1 Tax=Pythium oligandrum TaxID=41045 RepID=A0A8K1FGV1_PYTOL|nr:hypothetical protein Poli38472_011711 [Pythium oligandrum]|eukprot:TMW58123.1 hypothetical protein Poli38472_011711 [Pythium oligandrum]
MNKSADAERFCAFRLRYSLSIDLLHLNKANFGMTCTSPVFCRSSDNYSLWITPSLKRPSNPISNLQASHLCIV